MILKGPNIVELDGDFPDTYPGYFFISGQKDTVEQEGDSTNFFGQLDDENLKELAGERKWMLGQPSPRPFDQETASLREEDMRLLGALSDRNISLLNLGLDSTMARVMQEDIEIEFLDFDGLSSGGDQPKVEKLVGVMDGLHGCATPRVLGYLCVNIAMNRGAARRHLPQTEAIDAGVYERYDYAQSCLEALTWKYALNFRTLMVPLPAPKKNKSFEDI